MDNLFNFDWFFSSLNVMLYGMVGIFIVIGVIAILVHFLNKFFRDKNAQ